MWSRTVRIEGTGEEVETMGKLVETGGLESWDGTGFEIGDWKDGGMMRKTKRFLSQFLKTRRDDLPHEITARRESRNHDGNMARTREAGEKLVPSLPSLIG